jgi:hypothetical protein
MPKEVPITEYKSEMLPLNDPRWKAYTGPSGVFTTYDASTPLRNLLEGKPPETIFPELWEELHHQLVAINHKDHDWNSNLMECVAACTALARNQRVLGEIYHEFGLEDGCGWFESERGYRPGTDGK